MESDQQRHQQTSGGPIRFQTLARGREPAKTPSARMRGRGSGSGLDTPAANQSTTSQGKLWTGTHRAKKKKKCGGQNRPGEDQLRVRQRRPDWRGPSWRRARCEGSAVSCDGWEQNMEHKISTHDTLKNCFSFWIWFSARVAAAGCINPHVVYGTPKTFKWKWLSVGSHTAYPYAS